MGLSSVMDIMPDGDDEFLYFYIFLHKFCVEIIAIYLGTQNYQYVFTVSTYLDSIYCTIFYKDIFINI